MDKQIKNIKLLPNGDLRLKTGKKVTPVNRVITFTPEYTEYIVNNKYLCSINTSDYLTYALWANRNHMDHANPNEGVVAVDTGWSHRSVAALIMQTTGTGKRVGYKDFNRFNLRRENLVILSDED